MDTEARLAYASDLARRLNALPRTLNAKAQERRALISAAREKDQRDKEALAWKRDQEAQVQRLTLKSAKWRS